MLFEHRPGLYFTHLYLSHTHTHFPLSQCAPQSTALQHMLLQLSKPGLPSETKRMWGEVKASQVPARLPEKCKTTEQIGIKTNKTVNTFKLMTAQGCKEILHFIFSVGVRNPNAVCVDWTSLSLFCLCSTRLLLKGSNNQ